MLTLVRGDKIKSLTQVCCRTNGPLVLMLRWVGQGGLVLEWPNEGATTK